MLDGLYPGLSLRHPNEVACHLLKIPSIPFIPVKKAFLIIGEPQPKRAVLTMVGVQEIEDNLRVIHSAIGGFRDAVG